MNACKTASELPVARRENRDIERKIILTADDFGANRNVNEGIKQAADLGCINTISAFTNIPGSIEELKGISGKHPDIGIGVHLNILAGRPLTDPERIPSLLNENGEFYKIEEFLINLPSISEEEVYIEMKAQIDTLVSSGIKLDHISSHFAVFSLYTPYFEMRNKLAVEYGVPVRSPVSAGQKFPETYANRTNQKLIRQLSRKLAFRSPSTASVLKKEISLEEMTRKSDALDSLAIHHPDFMIDCLYGDPTPLNLIHIIENLPEGTSEIIVHLGKLCGDKDHSSQKDLFSIRQREAELMTISSPLLDEYLSVLKIKKSSYAELSR
jgi:predicted glycoside hydrolase/deacetylase ChbG (UPF0249 family)